jgi:hypothetical protein
MRSSGSAEGAKARAAFNLIWDINQVLKDCGPYSIVQNRAMVYIPGTTNSAPVAASFAAVPGKSCPEGLEVSATVHGPTLFSDMKSFKGSIGSLSWDEDGVSFSLDPERVEKRRPTAEDRRELNKKYTSWIEPSSMDFRLNLDRDAAAVAIAAYGEVARQANSGRLVGRHDGTHLVEGLLGSDAPVLRIDGSGVALGEGFSAPSEGSVQLRIDRSMLLKLTKETTLEVAAFEVGPGLAVVSFSAFEADFELVQLFKVVSF